MYRLRQQLRLLIALLVVLGVAYGGIKGWMYINVQQAMEELSVAAAGHAEIRYQDIDTDLRGGVTVRGVEVVPTGAPVPLRIASARLSGPPLTFFLLGQKREDPPPPRMFVDIRGMSIALDPELFDSMQSQFGAAEGGAGSGCAAGDDMNPELLAEMGFEQLVVNASMSYDYDASERSLRAQMDFDIEQMERVQASIALEDVAPDAMAGGTTSLPTLKSMGMDMRIEPAFGKRYLETCAQRLKLDPESYRRQLVDDTLVLLARAGLQLGPGLSAALEDYHRDWGEFSVSANPSEPLNPMALMFSPPADWQRALGIRVTVNQREISDLRFELRPPDAEELAVLLGQEVEQSNKPREKRPRYRYVYRPVQVSALDQHLGAEVKLHLTGDQPMRSGILVAVVGSEVRVEQRLHGGKWTAHVPMGDILRAEVQQVEKIPDGE